MNKPTLTVKLIRSPVGRRSDHLGLGLKKIRQTRVLEDTPAVRGMVNKVSYLVQIIQGPL